MPLDNLICHLFSPAPQKKDGLAKNATLTFNVSLGTDGLSAIASKLGCDFSDLLAFASESGARDDCNSGAPFKALVSRMDGGDQEHLIATLRRTGFDVSEGGDEVTIYIRGPRVANRFDTPVIDTDGASTHIPAASKSSSARGGDRLPTQVCTDVMRLVRELFPRDERGVWLPSSGEQGKIRPDWVKQKLWDSLRDKNGLNYDDDLAARAKVYAQT